MATSTVKLDRDLLKKADIKGKAFDRTASEQIEHWATVGKIMEDNPDLPYEFVKQAINSMAENEAKELEL